jgi:hypothetical protein
MGTSKKLLRLITRLQGEAETSTEDIWKVHDGKPAKHLSVTCPKFIITVS